jgi:hypothetical protein
MEHNAALGIYLKRLFIAANFPQNYTVHIVPANQRRQGVPKKSHCVRRLVEPV